jgi:hypothetical protein
LTNKKERKQLKYTDDYSFSERLSNLTKRRLLFSYIDRLIARGCDCCRRKKKKERNESQTYIYLFQYVEVEKSSVIYLFILLFQNRYVINLKKSYIKMYAPYYYSSPAQQQTQSSHWVYQPSFYNGYATTTPIIVNQPVPVVQNYLPPIEQHHHHHQQQQQHQISQSPPVIPSTYLSSMKPFHLFRNPFSSSNNSDAEYYFHEEQLNQNLSKHDIVRLPVKGDGNCLFYALAEGLMYEMKADPNEFDFQMRQLFRLPIHFRFVDFADRLRQICVDQWRLHEDYYSQFVDQEKVSFLKEVKKFSKNGVSDSILGDIVPLTIANTLNVKITIFTSVLDLPRIDVKPERKNASLLSTRKTIYLAYNQYGVGHYDAAYPRS